LLLEEEYHPLQVDFVAVEMVLLLVEQIYQEQMLQRQLHEELVLLLVGVVL
jgi:hypothetical protein